MAKQYPDVDFDQIIKDLTRGMNATEVNRRARESISFFKGANKAKTVETGRYGPELMMKGRPGVSDLIPGSMMTFVYDAKHAETLPFWDRHPLTIFLDVNRHGHFLQLNLHYLPPIVRAKILGLLMKTVTAKKMRHDLAMKITYGMTKSMAQYKPLQFCIKSYIPSRVQTKITRIPPSAWHHAIFFPSDRFIGKSNRGVWAEFKRFRPS